MTSYYLVIVGRDDKPVFELEYPVKKDQQHNYLTQFIAFSSLDIIDELQITTPAMYLKNVDKFNEWIVYAFAANQLRILVLVNSRSAKIEEALFIDIYQLYSRYSLNPLYKHNTPVKSADFERKMLQIAKKYLQ
ncbi:Trafficking protein particle complex subunit 2, partial [Fragariocoptes setiger]